MIIRDSAHFIVLALYKNVTRRTESILCPPYCGINPNYSFVKTEENIGTLFNHLCGLMFIRMKHTFLIAEWSPQRTCIRFWIRIVVANHLEIIKCPEISSVKRCFTVGLHNGHFDYKTTGAHGLYNTERQLGSRVKKYLPIWLMKQKVKQPSNSIKNFAFLCLLNSIHNMHNIWVAFSIVCCDRLVSLDKYRSLKRLICLWCVCYCQMFPLYTKQNMCFDKHDFELFIIKPSQHYSILNSSKTFNSLIGANKQIHAHAYIAWVIRCYGYLQK